MKTNEDACWTEGKGVLQNEEADSQKLLWRLYDGEHEGANEGV